MADYLSDHSFEDEPDGVSDDETSQTAPSHIREPLLTPEALALSAGATATASMLGVPVFQQVLFVLLANSQSNSALRQFLFVAGGNAVFALLAVTLGVVGRRRLGEDSPRWAVALMSASIIIGCIVLVLSIAGAVVIDIFGPESSNGF